MRKYIPKRELNPKGRNIDHTGIKNRLGDREGIKRRRLNTICIHVYMNVVQIFLLINLIFL